MMKVFFTLVGLLLTGYYYFYEESDDYVEEVSESDFVVEVNSYNETRTVTEVFSSLQSYYKENHPQISESLNSPASVAEINKFQEEIGVEIPEDVKSLYLLANGQNLEGYEHPFFYNGYTFLSIKDSLEIWKENEKHSDEDAMRGEASHKEKVIIDTWWLSKWIPIGQEATGGSLLFIDLSPGGKGKLGQVINWHDDGDTYHLGFSITDFLGDLDTGLRTGKYFMNPEYQIITGHEDF